MTIGIYLLSFNGTHKVYIGQSRISIEKRFSQHRAEFTNKTHSVKLNEAFNTYGMPECEILEECSISELDRLEKYHIKLWDAVKDGFNSLEEVHGGNLEGEDSPRALYHNTDILIAFNFLIDMPELSYNEVSKLSMVGVNTISQIANGITHKWISKEYPDKYLQLLALKGSRVNGASSAKKRGILYPSIVSPEGAVYIIDNIQEFSRIHNLCATNLCKVLHKKRKSIKGWKLVD